MWEIFQLAAGVGLGILTANAAWEFGAWCRARRRGREASCDVWAAVATLESAVRDAREFRARRQGSGAAEAAGAPQENVKPETEGA